MLLLISEKMSVNHNSILENLLTLGPAVSLLFNLLSFIQIIKGDFLNIKTSLYEPLLGDTHEADKLKVANFLVRG